MDLQEGINNSNRYKIKPPKCFPYCIVWAPIPLITWVVPFIGHMGICLSDGRILDFGGPFYVGVDSFVFGNPTRYIPINKNQLQDLDSFVAIDDKQSLNFDQKYDEALVQARTYYQGRMYNFCTDNCHCFVAHALNKLQYKKYHEWNMLFLALKMFIMGRFVSIWGFIKTFLPFVVMAVLCAYFGRQYFAYAYAGVLFFSLLGFIIFTKIRGHC